MILLFTSPKVFSDSFEEHIVFHGETLNNLSLEDYADKWWQWTYIMPKSLSPVRDQTGKNCHIGQSGKVWFLAGGYGNSFITRSCEIPEGKYIFFPVINNVYYTRTEGRITCESAKKLAAVQNDDLIDITIELDSLKSSNPADSRLSSNECFDLLGAVPRNSNPPKWYPAASDGYWIMLKPLSKGKHELKFNAAYVKSEDGRRDMVQDIQYHLTIK